MNEISNTFKQGATKFYEQTYGVIDINNGANGIVTTAMADFGKDVLFQLKFDEVNLFEQGRTINLTEISEHLIELIQESIESHEAKAYISEHQKIYARLLETKILEAVLLNQAKTSLGSLLQNAFLGTADGIQVFKLGEDGNFTPFEPPKPK